MSFFNFSDKMKEISEKALLKCSEKFAEIDRITEFNQQRVLNNSNDKASLGHEIIPQNKETEKGDPYGCCNACIVI